MKKYKCTNCGNEINTEGKCPHCSALSYTKPNRKPFGPLMAEHRLIEKCVALLEGKLKILNQGKQPNKEHIKRIIDFMRTYADKCHHGKEEDILFEALKRKDIPKKHKDIMNSLIDDHKKARKLVGMLENANETADIKKAKKAIKDIATLYPKHIETEDKHFFVPVMEYFSEEEQSDMVLAFWEFDRKQIHEKYRNIVEYLAKK
jgi:hemerythrin-like domain-containing protein